MKEPEEPIDPTAGNPEEINPHNSDSVATIIPKSPSTISSSGIPPNELLMIHQNDSSDTETQSFDNSKQLLQHLHNSSTVADLDALENLDISSKNLASESPNSSHAAVLQQLQQIRRMPLITADGGKNHESTTAPESRNNKDTPTANTAVVTSISQYELTQSHETVR